MVKRNYSDRHGIFVTVSFVVVCFTMFFFPIISQAQPPITQEAPQIWYGRVNHWADNPQLLKTEIRMMTENGISGYLIEMAGWNFKNESKSQWSKKWLKRTAKAYKILLKECRRNGLWLFVSVVNDNMGHHKYGDTGPELNVVYPQAQCLAKIIKKHGNKNVIVQPVAETQTEAGKQFEDYCLNELKEFQLVYNGNGGQPNELPTGFHFRAYHPAHIVSHVSNDSFIISDHGLLIRELTADGSLDNSANPQKLSEWFKRLERLGVPVIGYYAFQQKGIDSTTLKIIGKYQNNFKEMSWEIFKFASQTKSN